ncbi:hypothetical protein G3N95_29975 [Paraburkholderia sp. Tr-20389]|uniref:hypothetical protein n=1 Tax=Paraburkholderia sp. Tr-20389 TaxID=2703903 RepID=UPI001980381F|nr:hypothetical protein [Paraburkholderia sp. Tr-20389]MBN3757203.1 hypothetical protein [Paraburkholderia sp. Tr-20389]
MTQDQSDEVEHLLRDWFEWQCRQSIAMHAKMYYRPADSMGRQSITNRTCEEDDEAAYEWADSLQSEQVQLCVDDLTIEQRAAISTTMRNKASDAMVWRSVRAGSAHETYQQAKEDLLPMLKRRGLIGEEIPA